MERESSPFWPKARKLARHISLRLHYGPSVVALVEEAINDSKTQDNWDARLLIELSRHGQDRLVHLAHALTDLERKQLISRLQEVPGLQEYVPKKLGKQYVGSEDGTLINLIREAEKKK